MTNSTEQQCGVKNCKNTRASGEFIGPFCAPCVHDLRTGNFEFGTSVVYEQAREIERLRQWQHKACDVLPLVSRDSGTPLAERISELLQLESTETCRQCERVLSLLQLYGVPTERARSSVNGIEVLMTRMRRQVNDLEVTNGSLTARIKALETALDWALPAVFHHYTHGESPKVPGAHEELEKSRERILAELDRLMNERGGSTAEQTVVKEIGDTFESTLNVEILSDTPEKVQRFEKELCKLILDAPAAGNHDVMVTVVRADELPVFESNRSPKS